ncbi:flavin reductase family protein [Neorhizobium galegae]|uniref:flavin reductase family protein n=1 Tax=Neorhizobium galegae TaxID=399 RepID=UPI0012D608E5|nr:hypothetical protein F4V90_23185 [Neorhizobium galegae]
MNITAISFEEHVSEIEMAELTLRSGRKIACPAIAEAPASLECRLHSFVDLGRSREVILGEIVAAQLRRDMINDLYHIDPVILDAVGRMGGARIRRRGTASNLSHSPSDTERQNMSHAPTMSAGRPARPIMAARFVIQASSTQPAKGIEPMPMRRYAQGRTSSQQQETGRVWAEMREGNA